jgi:hypothetical protein
MVLSHGAKQLLFEKAWSLLAAALPELLAR